VLRLEWTYLPSNCIETGCCLTGMAAEENKSILSFNMYSRKNATIYVRIHSYGDGDGNGNLCGNGISSSPGLIKQSFPQSDSISVSVNEKESHINCVFVPLLSTGYVYVLLIF